MSRMIEDKEDFFEKSPDDIPKKVKEPKQPTYKPDDPRYYDREEGKWDHLKPAPYQKGPIIWIVGGAIVAMCILVGMYVYFFSPQVQEASEYGYVDEIHKEGIMFQTFEGVLLPYKNLMDSTREYKGDFVFSTNNDSIATQLLRQHRKGRPVRVGYQVYRFKMPWRGNTKVIVTEVDTTISPDSLLPFDRQPEIVRNAARVSEEIPDQK